ncbi:probable enoyl-CoA hydratase [Rhagoletis pomonella]|uniref:probable enoyl-CoA hydratase n=1 Tax=Rhagoletis pomonella TaxID=28610 RepID=UPI00177D1ABB|nr:probable enoyl-CoA hydratase [Rhagoletis pomonella]
MANVLNPCRSGYLDGILRLTSKVSVRKKQSISTAASGNGSNCTGPPVLIDKDDRITLIGLNRSRNRNSIDEETAGCLSGAIATFENDKTSPVAVIYGIGGSFCAGQDLTELEKRCKINAVNQKYKEFCLYHNFLRRHSKKPIICGINGYCIADGLELAMFCDLRVMEDTAVLGFFGRSIGLNIECGGIGRLPALIGYSRALDLILTGRRVDGQEALNIGLVNRLVATGTALGQAVNLAFSIAKFPMEAVNRDRSNMFSNYYERRKGLSTAIEHETASLNSINLLEFEEGVERFKNAQIKGLKTDLWQVKPKMVPEWEKEEILNEQRGTTKCNC